MMISCSVNPSPCGLSGLIHPRPPPLRPLPPTLSVISAAAKSCHLSLHPLRISSSKCFPSHVNQPKPLFQCSAAAARPESESAPTAVKSTITTPQLCLQTGLLSFINSFLTVTTKFLFNHCPFPWFTSAVFLAAGPIIMAVCWLNEIFDPPKTDRQFWLSLAPVAMAHAVGVVAAAVSLSKLPAYYARVLACGVPAFRLLLSGLLLGQWVPREVSRSILLIASGFICAAPKNNDFSIIGFTAAMVSNLAFALKDFIYERTSKGTHEVTGANYYACLSMMSFLFIVPFALMIEGSRLAAGGWEMMVVGKMKYVLEISIILYHWYNMEAYEHFPNIRPFQFIEGKTINQAHDIFYSFKFFATPVHQNNLVGSIFAVLGSYACFEGSWHFSGIKSRFL